MFNDTWGRIINGLTGSDFGRDGTPKVKALEAAYEAETGDAIDLNAGDRDALWDAYNALPEDTAVTLVAARANPLRIDVNGETILKMSVGETADLDNDVMERALAVPGVNFVKGSVDD